MRSVADPALGGFVDAVDRAAGSRGRILTTDGRAGYFWFDRATVRYATRCSDLAGFDVLGLLEDHSAVAYSGNRGNLTARQRLINDPNGLDESELLATLPPAARSPLRLEPGGIRRAPGAVVSVKLTGEAQYSPGMDITGKRLVVIGGAGLIGSHTVDALTREDVGEIVVYDNFVPRHAARTWPRRCRRPRVRDLRGRRRHPADRHPRRRAEGRRRRLPLRRAVAAAVPRVPALGVRRERPRHVQRARGLRRQGRQAARLLLVARRSTATRSRSR